MAQTYVFQTSEENFNNKKILIVLNEITDKQ